MPDRRPRRLLPNDAELTVLLASQTRQQIAKTYGVSKQAVSNRISRGNLPTPRTGMLPWTLSGNHGQRTEAQYLRALVRQARGTARPADRTLRSATAWAERLARHRQALTYTTRDGFTLVPYDQVGQTASLCVIPNP